MLGADLLIALPLPARNLTVNHGRTHLLSSRPTSRLHNAIASAPAALYPPKGAGTGCPASVGMNAQEPRGLGGQPGGTILACRRAWGTPCSRCCSCCFHLAMASSNW